MIDDPNLKRAYAIASVEDAKAIYGKWAPSYDTGFAEQQGYQLPREVALAFVTAGGTGPVLDVGAGTGLVAEHLERMKIGLMDALDISADMLAVADVKGLYHDLIEADVSKPLVDFPRYNGIVSAGTFTLGHVGPEGITHLLDIAASGCLFVISINLKHFEACGFAALLDGYAARITGVSFKDVRIYDDRAEAPHCDDMARLLIFRTV